MEFNKQLQLLQETGLIDFWIRNLTDSRESNEEKVPTKLEMTNILAAFQFCGAMYVFSFIVFILEIISTKSKCIRNIIEYLTY